ncbi:glycosyltransferase [Plantactinospora soyae]|uniref:Glycosyltransferase involved in cell wall biosynthesis n=1 Tax=Plantactinospora soyae TaxID=1544732 RepID=A0A927MBE4_9ACTN|nr:glycosyltransferase [Plantactinospora soyae]MBE1488723.1 glycosyltransferase involved in cell wall biosynthesis [Plantactinospora soyae]
MVERLRVAVLLKTNDGGMWILPQVTELRSRGHEVVVVLPPGPGRLTAELTRRGFDVRESPFDFRFRPGVATLRGLWRLRRLLGRLRPDVLHYHLYASALAARFGTLGLPVRRVHMVAGPLFLESPLIRPVERLLWRLDHATICGTAHTSGLYGALGCPPARRPVATYGVDPAHFAVAHSVDEVRPGTPDVPTRDEERAKARAELGVDSDAFLVVMIAYVYPPKRLAHNGRAIKGHDVLLTAWQTFRAGHPRAHLLLVGGGWGAAGEAHRRELVHRFGVDTDPSVTWLESVADVRPCHRAADLSVSPSLSEGHGAAVEASAMGVPSIVSDAGGLPETVDGSSGWIVPRGDAPALASALQAAYREFGTGRLAERGEQARLRAVRLFDNRASAVRVADVIEHVARDGAGKFPDRALRVAHVIGSLDRGGAETVTLDICRSVPSAEVEQVFLTLAGREGRLVGEFRAAGAVVRQCPLRPARSFGPRLFGALRAVRPDIVVSHVSLVSAAILLVARAARVPVRVARMWSEGDGRPDTRTQRARRAMLRQLLRHTATDIVGVTSAALDLAGPRAGDTRYRVLYNSVSTDRVDGWQREPARRRWNLPAEAPVLVHIGRAASAKNRPFLVDVHRAVRLELPDARLLAVGPGGVDDIVTAYPDAAYDPYVVLGGETEEIASVLAAADVLVLPSRREGLPGVVLEALAAGVPVVATDLPCLRELASHLHGLTLLPLSAGARRWAEAATGQAGMDAAGRRQISRSLRSSPFVLEHAVREWKTLWRAGAR